LFQLLPPLDVVDPEAFLAAASALFAQYPPDLQERAAMEIPQRSDRPTLKFMRDVLDDLQDRALERQSANEQKRMIPYKPAPRTPEQQARADEQVIAIRKAHGIPPGGFHNRKDFAKTE
jgi:hypothetical protein